MVDVLSNEDFILLIIRYRTAHNGVELRLVLNVRSGHLLGWLILSRDPEVAAALFREFVPGPTRHGEWYIAVHERIC